VDDKCKTVRRGCVWTTNPVRRGCVWKTEKKCLPRRTKPTQRPLVRKALSKKQAQRAAARRRRRGGKKANKKYPNPKVPRSLFCRSGGKPLMQPFTGKGFSPRFPGDFVLARTGSFRVDTRFKRWYTEVVNVGFAVVTNTRQDRVEVITEENILIDGKRVTVKVGETLRIQFGGSVSRPSKDVIRVTGASDQYVEGTFFHEGKDQKWPEPQYVTLTVFVPESIGTVQGMCGAGSDNFRGKGIFQTPAYYPVVPAEKLVADDKRKKEAEEICKRRGVVKRLMQVCVTDVVNSGKSLHFRN